MSVYTTVSAEDLDAWLTRYGVGTLRELDPIKAGIENTNYFVTTDRGRYVLTLYERLPADELPFYLNLMAHLAKAGVAVPAPSATAAIRKKSRFIESLLSLPAAATGRGVPAVSVAPARGSWPAPGAAGAGRARCGHRRRSSPRGRS